MRIDGGKFAALIALAFLSLALSGAFEAALSGISTQIIQAIWLQPRSIATTLVCLIVAIGLWQHLRMAWWLGTIAGAIQIFFIVQLWAMSPAIAIENVPSQLLVVGFLLVLAHPQTRRLCVRHVRT